MNHHAPQLEHNDASQARCMATVPSPTRRLGTGPMCLLVMGILILHWLGMQCIVNWLGGEGTLLRAQTVRTSATMPDDGWRRTARGWEYMMNDSSRQPQVMTSPTQHISPYQFWPAAAAACMLLLITGLPESRATANANES